MVPCANSTWPMQVAWVLILQSTGWCHALDDMPDEHATSLVCMARARGMCWMAFLLKHATSLATECQGRVMAGQWGCPDMLRAMSRCGLMPLSLEF